MQNRVEKLAAKLNENEAAIVISDINRYYLTGFKSSSGAVVVTKDKAYLLVDFRYSEAASKKVKSCEVVEFKRMNDAIQNIVTENEIKEVIIEYESVALSVALRLLDKLEEVGVHIKPDDRLEKLLNSFRMIKSADEIELIDRSQRITEKAFNHALSIIKEGITEREIAFEIEMCMRRNGAEGVAFDLITITGAKTSLPHGEPDDNVVKKGDFITMDIGAVYNGYHSDMTRTVALGSVTDEQRKIYNIVLEAQLAGLKAVKPGVICSSVDKASRDVITSYGYGEYFGHSTGHSVGLEIHESPSFSYACDEILQAGTVMTVEPGIYLPDKFGVRIEDMVLVTEDGYRNFTTIPKELMIL
ncbi:MAG: M24 family metallopeptidase [Acutalibacteraceae bacterium]